jgi:hypothetical protein
MFRTLQVTWPLKRGKEEFNLGSANRITRFQAEDSLRYKTASGNKLVYRLDEAQRFLIIL